MKIATAKRFFVPTPSPKDAAALQKRWRESVSTADRHGRMGSVCGVDVAYDPARNLAFAAAVRVSWPGLDVLEEVAAASPVRFPYIPGLLGFREAPAVLEALALLKESPDLLLVDGHGRAHPRRCGLASMLGLALDVPALGCGKSLLVGEFDPPGAARGSWTPLRHKGEIIGSVLRTRDGVSPVFVSVGHRVSLAFARRVVLAAAVGRRLPLPIHRADRAAARAKRTL